MLTQGCIRSAASRESRRRVVEARRDLVVAPSVTYSIPGTRAPLGSTLADGCTIASGVDPSAYPVGTTLHLGFAPGTIGDFPSSATGVQWVSAIVGNHGVLKHEVQNLTALTQYIAGLSPTGTLGDWIGNPIAFRTMADPTSITESVTISWALGSCQYWWVNNPPTSGTKFEYAWQDILSNPVDFFGTWVTSTTKVDPPARTATRRSGKLGRPCTGRKCPISP